MRILTIGSATQDIFIGCSPQDIKEFSDNPEISKVNVEYIHRASGGGATNAAVAFKRQGFQVSAFFKIGNDHYGTFIVNELQKEHIDLTNIVTASTPSGVSFIVPVSREDQRIFAYRGANAQLTTTDIPFDTIKTSNALYITSLPGNSAAILPDIITFARQQNIFIAHNPGTSQLKKHAGMLTNVLKYIDILILNHYEASLFFAQLSNKPLKPPFDDYFQTVLAHGLKIAVITDGPHGVYAATANDRYFQPSLATNVINTVGAGDAFGATFVASILQGLSLPQALFNGCGNSASVLEHNDAKTGLLTTQELKKRLGKFPTAS